MKLTLKALVLLLVLQFGLSACGSGLSDSGSNGTNDKVDQILVPESEEVPEVKPPEPLNGAAIWNEMLPVLELVMELSRDDPAEMWTQASEEIADIADRASSEELSKATQSIAETIDVEGVMLDLSSSMSALDRLGVYLDLLRERDKSIGAFQTICVQTGSSPFECGLDKNLEGSTSSSEIDLNPKECYTFKLSDISGIYDFTGVATPCDEPHTAKVLGRKVSTALTTMPPEGIISSPTKAAAAHLKSAAPDYLWCYSLAEVAVPGILKSRFDYNLMYEEDPEGGMVARCELILDSPDGIGLDNLPIDRFTRGTADAFPECYISDTASPPMSIADCKSAQFKVIRGVLLNPSGSVPYPGDVEAKRQTDATCKSKIYISWQGEVVWALGGLVKCLQRINN